MKKEKILSVLLILIMIFSLIGCGNSVPAVNENVADNSTEEMGEETVDKVTATEQPDAMEPPMTAEPESTVAVEPTATPEPTAAPTSTPEPTPTPTPEPTATPHVHVWTETVTRSAGCATVGEKKLVCECGESKVESIPATGSHNWVEGLMVVHHEALGHVQEVQVQVGTSAGYTIYACATCGAEFDTPSGVVDHCVEYVGTDRNHAVSQTVAYDYPGEPIYETQSQWVVDQPEWDEVVGTGTYTCSVCGATK